MAAAGTGPPSVGGGGRRLCPPQSPSAPLSLSFPLEWGEDGVSEQTLGIYFEDFPPIFLIFM